jgi:tRNA(fMet)-specific endonuclease VapC
MYLLDSDVLSDLLRRAPSPALLTRLASVPPDQQFTSSIALGELVWGAHRRGDRAEELVERIERVLLPNLPVIPFDARAALVYGEVRARLEERGVGIGEVDLRTASIALGYRLTVVTGRGGGLRGVPGVMVEDWLG